MSRDLPSNAEILRQASRMRVADPSADPGAFGAMSKFDMLVLLRLMGLRGVTPDSVLTEDEVRQKVRLALWDMQRYVREPRATVEQYRTQCVSKARLLVPRQGFWLKGPALS